MRYFLFGGDAVNTYENEGASAIVGSDYVIDYELYVHDSQQDLTTLLSNYSGWNNFLELTSDQYNEIIELEKQN